MTDEFYMRKALEQAALAFEKDEVPVGAVVVCRDRIIARTYNLTETLNDVTAHAEMQAITAAAPIPWRKVSRCLHALRHCGALRDVCRSHRLVAVGASGVWCRRSQTRLQRICPESPSSQDGGVSGVLEEECGS